MTMLLLTVFAADLWGQTGGTCPKLQFTYDNAGNRIQRQYVTCFVNDEADLLALKANKQENNKSLNTSSSKLNLKAFPNPNNGVFEVLIENPQENAMLELYDFTGRKVSSQSVNASNIPMNISNMATGTYMLLYREPQKILGSLKLVIE